MTGEEAQKLAFEGHWMRRKSWTMWPYQVVVHAEWLESQFGIDFDWQEGKPQFERIELVDVVYEEGQIPSGHADYAPSMPQEEWEGDDWEIFDYSIFKDEEF